MELLRPFGPSIGRERIPNEIHSSLLQLTDEVLADKNRENIGDKLAGQIKEQNEVPIKKLIKHNVFTYFMEMVDFYYQGIFQGLIHEDDHKGLSTENTMTSCWVNSMYKHEWNPIHSHSHLLSAIIILKVPKDLKPPEGMIGFANNPCRMPFELEHGIQVFMPKEQHFYLFPARLNHSVNPFTCDGERRTMSFNIHTNLGEK
tara:strand:- start:240 stop:845 length:606 start_codon:yes stop_codon:yes gene_type:complete